MLTKNARQALELIGLIAAVPAHQFVTIVSLAQHMNVSVSYLETICKKLLKGGVVKSHRGPGGGYQLAHPISDLTAWDVVCVFIESRVKENPVEANTDQVSLKSLDESYRVYAIAALKNTPLNMIKADAWFHAPVSKTTPLGFHMKPLPKPIIPHAPRSVFDLHAFMEMDLV